MDTMIGQRTEGTVKVRDIRVLERQCRASNTQKESFVNAFHESILNGTYILSSKKTKKAIQRMDIALGFPGQARELSRVPVLSDAILSFRNNVPYLCSDRQLWNEIKQDIVEIMEKFGIRIDWWKTEDPYVMVKYQIEAPNLLYDFRKYHKALATVLKREVWDHEAYAPTSEFKNEVRIALEKYEKGEQYGISDTEKAQLNINAINRITQAVKEKNGTTIPIEPGDVSAASQKALRCLKLTKDVDKKLN